MNEKRSTLRIAVQRPVHLVLNSGKKVFAMMTNISPDGMGILFHSPADPGLKMIIRFNLPSEQSSDQLTLDAIVTHCHIQDNNYYIGVKFNRMTRAQKFLLNSFIYLKQTQYVSAA